MTVRRKFAFQLIVLFRIILNPGIHLNLFKDILMYFLVSNRLHILKTKGFIILANRSCRAHCCKNQVISQIIYLPYLGSCPRGKFVLFQVNLYLLRNYTLLFLLKDKGSLS